MASVSSPSRPQPPDPAGRSAAPASGVGKLTGAYKREGRKQMLFFSFTSACSFYPLKIYLQTKSAVNILRGDNQNSRF